MQEIRLVQAAGAFGLFGMCKDPSCIVQQSVLRGSRRTIVSGLSIDDYSVALRRKTT